MPEPAASPSRRSAFPDWVLLDTVASVGRRCENATTARTVTSSGHPIEVSFEVVDPPGLSRCVVYCPDQLTPRDTPRVTGADGAFLLIRVCFPAGHTPTDVFLYKAGGPAGTPSLYLLPRPYPVDLHFNPVAVLSCRGGPGGVFTSDDHCLVVIPERRFEAGGRMLSYDLKIFSTKTESWSRKVARVASYLNGHYGGLARLEPTKVLNVGGGSLAWVDLWHGILFCNVLSEDPEMRLIPLPALMPANKVNFQVVFDGCDPPLRSIRDVTCTNSGSIKFIEMELVLDDDSSSNTATTRRYPWTATVWKTTVSSGGDYWEWCRTIDSSDLSPADSCVPDLFPEIWDDEEKRLTLDSRVISHSPILDMYRDHFVYMTSKLVGCWDPNGWVLAIDTRNNKLERAVPFSAERMDFEDTKLQCAFSKHLSMGDPTAQL